MKSYWNVECSNCSLTLRLTVEEKDVGKTVEAICPQCKTQTKTTIGVPVSEEDLQEISPELKQKMVELAEKITANPEIAEIMEAIRDEGFGVFFVMGLYERIVGKKAKPVPKVDEDGNVKVGTFTQKDEEELRKFFKIEL